MGHVHHAPHAASERDVAGHLPALADRDVVRLVALAGAYTDARAVLVALAGLSVLQTTGRHAAGDVGAVLTGLVAHLESGRGQLAGAAGSQHPGVRGRLEHLGRAIALLSQEIERVGSGLMTHVSLDRLHVVRGLLRDSAVPDAGMRELTSTSCASWHSHHH